MKRQDLVNWIASFKTVRERIARMLREKRPKAEILTSLKVDDLTGWKPNQFWTKSSLPGLVDEMSR